MNYLSLKPLHPFALMILTAATLTACSTSGETMSTETETTQSTKSSSMIAQPM